MASDDLEVPDAYDEESYRAGYAAAMTHIGHLALSGADGLAPSGASVDERGDDDSGDGVCPECGAETLASMGAPEDVTPGGRVCPSCEL